MAQYRGEKMSGCERNALYSVPPVLTCCAMSAVAALSVGFSVCVCRMPSSWVIGTPALNKVRNCLLNRMICL